MDNFGRDMSWFVGWLMVLSFVGVLAITGGLAWLVWLLIRKYV